MSRSRLRGDEVDNETLSGRIVVMTGATSGLGAVAATTLARRGARLVVVARDRDRAARTLAALRAANPGEAHAVHLADLSRLEEMKRVARDIAAAEPRIDVLVNNAGAIFGPSEPTVDGLERTFATNHLAYMVLTLGLRGPLAAAPAARVVSTASAAHRSVRFDPADVQGRRLGMGWQRYALSKLYNILFTRELARRWSGTGITANCFHPGVVATRFGDATGGLMTPLIGLIKRFALTPEAGAAPLIRLAASPDVAAVSGRYFDKGGPIAPTSAGQDDTAAAALWTASLRLADLRD